MQYDLDKVPHKRKKRKGVLFSFVNHSLKDVFFFITFKLNDLQQSPVEGPLQSSPPCAGGGRLQALLLVLVLVSHMLQVLHPPSTEKGEVTLDNQMIAKRIVKGDFKISPIDSMIGRQVGSPPALVGVGCRLQTPA